MKKITILLFLGSALLLFNDCTKKVAKPTPVVVAEPTVSKCDTITFTKHIKPIVEASCIDGCHNESFSGANYKLYADLKEKALNGKLKGYVVDGVPRIMPKFGNKLEQAKLDLILCWISNGAKQ